MTELIDISKSYGDKTVFESFNASFPESKITAVLGESGSGKTTLLNILAGLTDYSGEIKNAPKRVAFVFQRDRLVKNLTVKQNIELVTKTADVSAALEDFGLGGCENKYPEELSAGMARRVAILRATLFDSDTVLMDEPFVNLDVALKYRLIEKIKAKCKSGNKTVIFVTHDIKEAVTFADEIVVLSHGKTIKIITEINKETENDLFNLMLSL